jgi:two-component system OmpR family response regulator
MSGNKTLLVVDDDPQLRQLVREYLGEHGYTVRVAADGVEMWAEIEKPPVDMVILDLMLPGEDGLALCRDLRSRSSVPILMLTARGGETDRIVGLEMGADDYLPKPFSPRELLARIKSILRRAQDGVAVLPSREFRFARWTLDTGAHHLVDENGVVVPLSTGEYRLLKALVENGNRVMSRDQLMESLAGRESGPFDRTIDVMISRLRRRLGDDAREPALIKTVRNGGYLLAAKVERGP